MKLRDVLANTDREPVEPPVERASIEWVCSLCKARYQGRMCPRCNPGDAA